MNGTESSRRIRQRASVEAGRAATRSTNGGSSSPKVHPTTRAARWALLAKRSGRNPSLIAIILLIAFTTALPIFQVLNDNSWTLSSSSSPVMYLQVEDDTTRKLQRRAVVSVPNTTLALLYPPGIFGGFRNQCMRFSAFVVHAVEQNLTQLHLNSLVWTTHVVLDNTTDILEWYPLPMDLIFDVKYWNENTHLPLLVKDLKNSDCWRSPSDTATPLSAQTSAVAASSNAGSLKHIQQTTLAHGYLEPIANISKGLLTRTITDFALRKNDMWHQVRHCNHPVVYGGGKGAGRLWNKYLHLSRTNATEFAQLQPHILRSLRPAPRWRKVAQDYCLHQTTSTYLALHARVELEMMAHPCGINMEGNLTRILEHVTGFLQHTKDGDVIENIIIMLWRGGMYDAERFEAYRAQGAENVRTLDRYTCKATSTTPTSCEKLGDKYSLVECGGDMMKRYYHDNPDVMDHGTILEQVINFDVAVNAEYFVGVYGSSYSNDVWTTRYYMGEGSNNYQYTKDGIFPIENGGLPERHGNCRGKKKKQ